MGKKKKKKKTVCQLPRLKVSDPSATYPPKGQSHPRQRSPPPNPRVQRPVSAGMFGLFRYHDSHHIQIRSESMSLWIDVKLANGIVFDDDPVVLALFEQRCCHHWCDSFRVKLRSRSACSRSSSIRPEVVRTDLVTLPSRHDHQILSFG